MPHDKMHIIVASRNPAKVRSVEAAFASRFPAAALKISAVEVESEVSAQPRSDEETRCGAHNRVRNARLAHPQADFWVGLEGGIETRGEHLMAFAWMAVQGRSGEASEARSVTLPLPPAVGDLLESGLELGEANDRVFATQNSKQQGGAYGLLTDDLYTREGIYTQTVIIALIPHVNPLYPQAMQR